MPAHLIVSYLPSGFVNRAGVTFLGETQEEPGHVPHCYRVELPERLRSLRYFDDGGCVVGVDTKGRAVAIIGADSREVS